MLHVCLSLVSVLTPEPPQQNVLALVGARIYPMAGAYIPRGTVLIADGKVTAVGPQVAIPAGARRVSIEGKVIIPGLIDARSSLFLGAAEIGAAGAGDRDVLDGADLFDNSALDALRRGVTTVYITPGSRSTITGLGAIVKLGNGRTETGTLASPLRSQAALKVNLGVSSGNRSSSLDRISSYEAIRSAFRSAEQYARSFERFERESAARTADGGRQTTETVTRGQGDGVIPSAATRPPSQGLTTPAQRPTRPRRVPAQEVLLKALRREIPVRIEAHRADDILNALRLMDEFKLKLVLEGAEEAPLVAKEIARRKVPVVWGPTLPESAVELDSKGQTPAGAAKLALAGVRVALSPASESGRASRFVLENAAAAAGFGLSRDKALSGITTDAAHILGVADRIGTISRGKDADLVVLSAPPFDPAARVEQVFVNGERVYAR